MNFNADRFKEDIIKHAGWDKFHVDSFPIEEICDDAMKKFFDIEAIDYEINDELNSVKFIVYTNDLKKHYVSFEFTDKKSTEENEA